MTFQKKLEFVIFEKPETKLTKIDGAYSRNHGLHYGIVWQGGLIFPYFLIFITEARREWEFKIVLQL